MQGYIKIDQSDESPTENLSVNSASLYQVLLSISRAIAEKGKLYCTGSIPIFIEYFHKTQSLKILSRRISMMVNCVQIYQREICCSNLFDKVWEDRS
jgi:hypothetical protein